MPGHHFVGDAGEFGDLLRDRNRGFVEGRKDGGYGRYSVVRQIGELDHGKFNDFVLCSVQAGRLDIDEDACPGDLAVACGEFFPREKLAKNAVIGRPSEHLGHFCQIGVFRLHDFIRQLREGATSRFSIPQLRPYGQRHTTERRIVHLGFAAGARNLSQPRPLAEFFHNLSYPNNVRLSDLSAPSLGVRLWTHCGRRRGLADG